MGISTISMVIFNSYVTNYQRVCQFLVLSSMSCCWHAVGRHTIRSSNMAIAVAGKCWENPLK